MPLDDFVPDPAIVMQVVGTTGERPPVAEDMAGSFGASSRKSSSHRSSVSPSTSAPTPAMRWCRPASSDSMATSSSRRASSARVLTEPIPAKSPSTGSGAAATDRQTRSSDDETVATGCQGAEKPAILHTDGTYRDLSSVVPDLRGEALTPAGLAKIRAADPAKLPVLDSKLRIGPCVGFVGKFICVGLNYADHAAETGAAIPAEPILSSTNRPAASSSAPTTTCIIPVPRRSPIGGSSSASSSARKPATSTRRTRSTNAGYCVMPTTSQRALFPDRSAAASGPRANRLRPTFGPIGAVARDHR